MSDTLDASAAPRRLLVDGRNPFADEAITVSDPSILTVAPADADGNVFVSVTDGAADQAVATISVDPGSEDTNRTSGSDDITVTVPAPPTPLAVSLE